MGGLKTISTEISLKVINDVNIHIISFDCYYLANRALAKG